jgi:hypothetical protein
MMLRLADLPKGYRGGDDVGCGQFVSTEGASPDLDTFLSETRPRACTAEFNRAWGDGARSVQSSLLIFESPEAARRGWDLRSGLFRHLGGIFLSEEFDADGRGDEAVRFESEGLNEAGAGVAWLDGRLLAVV